MELIYLNPFALLLAAIFSIVFTAFVFKAVCFDPLLKEVKALRNELADRELENVTVRP